MDGFYARDGAREIAFRHELIRGGVAIRELPVISAEVHNDEDGEIKRTARYEIWGGTDIRWLSDRIKSYLRVKSEDEVTVSETPLISWGEARAHPWSRLAGSGWGDLLRGVMRSETVTERWQEYPLGVFLPTTPTRLDGETTTYSVEAYDLTVILREDCLTDWYFIAAGAGYIDEIVKLLIGAGIQHVIATPSDKVLPASREFEMGADKLTIINTLLSEINYNPIAMSGEGAMILTPYTEPGADDARITYAADEMSVMAGDVTVMMDAYGVPNVFVAVCSNPELLPLKSVFINDNPVSDLSTVKRGRSIVSEIYKPDMIGSQKDLDLYIRRIAFERSQVYEESEFTTLLMPGHEHGDIVALRHPKLSGVFQERSWRMELRIGGRMVHRVRRLMVI